MWKHVTKFTANYQHFLILSILLLEPRSFQFKEDGQFHVKIVYKNHEILKYKSNILTPL